MNLRILDRKVLAFVAHIALGGLWSALILIVRYFYPEELKSAISIQAIFVFFSFLFSFGFSTLVRLLVYEKKTRLVKDVILLNALMQVLISALSMFFSNELALGLAMSSAYNVFFIFVNVSISLRSYAFATLYCCLCSLVIVLAMGCYIFLGEFYVVISVIIINFLILLILLKKWQSSSLESKLALLTSWREVARGPVLLFSSFPLRVSILALGTYFGGSSSTEIQSIMYADALVFFGIASILAGRFFLFNERGLSALAERSIGSFVLYQAMIGLPFLVYGYFVLNVDWVYLVPVVSLYSVREIYGLHATFLRGKERYRLVVSYGSIAVLAFILGRYFEDFWPLAISCFFFPIYYIVLNPLKRSKSGSIAKAR
ncbi:hypothetical protein SAMN04487880_0598 [Marinobacter sp. es.042]|uniref:hypothetical protein n=1 Tax=Marinobacter sp. es.042 TaxID=1761794 RepID=UPI000B511909|nr:hypothetical protein [Marinobacter sp. es.042]SNB54887.1 hypothetical protein SAMN04487880_0598 [Marinobacter sp. es.042]